MHPAAIAARLRAVALPWVALRLVGQGAEFLAWVLLARRLGTADFGRLSVAYLVCRYGGLVGDWGASIQGVRQVAAADDPGAVHALVRRRRALTVPLTVAFVVGTVAAGVPRYSPLAAVIAGRGLGRDWLALGERRATRSGLPSATQGLSLLAAALFVGDDGAAAAAVGGSWLLYLGLSVALNRLPDHRGAVAANVAGWLLLALLADQIYASSDTILLAALRSPSDAGVYAAVYRLPNAWITVLGLLTTGLVPAATRALRDQPDRLHELRRRALRVGGSVAAALVVAAPLLALSVPLIFGQDYERGRTAVLILLLATAAASIAAPLTPLYLAVGSDRAMALTALGAAVLNLGGNALMIPAFGMNGAAVTTLMSQAVLLFFFWRETGRLSRRRRP